MFNDIPELDGYLESLRLEEILFRNSVSYTGNFLNSEDYFCLAWEEIAGLSSEFVELEHTDSILYKFSFPGLVKFYELCKEHSKLNKINFKKNPHVTEAENNIREIIKISYLQNIAWNLWIPRKIIKKKRYMFIVETGCYFEQHIELLDTLFEIRDYYDQKSRELYEELYGKPKVIKLTEAQQEMRKAA